MAEPRTTPNAGVKRAAEGDSLRQMKVGIGKGFPSLAQLVVAQMRCIVAGELGGERGALEVLGRS